MGYTNSIEYDANNYMSAALAPVELAYKQEVLKDTWGHLAPKRNKTHRGFIVFTITTYGNMEMIDNGFDGLPDSPWLFDAMQEFAFSDWENLEHGTVYRFDGTFRNYEFKGTRTILYRAKQ
jgi:hypothetical protein